MGNELVLPPSFQGSRPKVPIEARLIGRENTPSLSGVLRLVTEWVRRPGLTIVRALEFDLVTPTGYDGDRTVPIGDTERFEVAHRSGWQGQARRNHPGKLRVDVIEDPTQGERH